MTQVLNDTANHEILVLNIPMDSFGAFIGDLQALLTLIQTKTGNVFIPIAVSHSPVKPTEEFIIVLRTHDNVQAFPLDGWFTTNIPQLCKKFVTKTIKLDASFTPGSYHATLTKMLRQFNSSENLNLIGGFQDNKKQI